MSTKSNDPVLDSLSPADHERLLTMVKNGISRRDFMQYTMAAGATAAASSALFSGISDAWAQTPKRGGRIVFAGDQHGPNDTMDPALYTSAVDYFRARMFYGSLTTLTENLSYKPELAEEIISNRDATEWTFKLRRGVEFHDGKTFDADDVIYTMNRHLGKAILSSPNADLPIALGTFHFKILQNGTTDFRTAVGTGPYRVKEFKPGVRAIGTNFENYWGEGGYLDEIEHFGIGDPVARLNAFLAGDIHGMANLQPKAIPQVESTPGKAIWSLNSSAYINIACRQDMSLSGNPDLVLAMKYLMDRQRLVKGVYKGQATLGNDHPIGAAYFDHSPNIPQRPLDPDMAAYHFKRSGVGNTTVPVSLPSA